MITCPKCGGRMIEKDKYGTKMECELCATEYYVKAYSKGEKSE